MKPTVLFVTLGQTDLQVLGRKGDELCRLSLRKNLRHFHQAFLDGKIPFRIEPEAVQYREAGRDYKLDWDMDQGAYKTPAGYEVVMEDGAGLVLAPAKLGTTVVRLKEQEDIQIGAIILFTTSRDETTPPGVYHNEPIAAGPIIARWLAGQFGLQAAKQAGDIGHGRVGWIDMMDGEMLSPGPGRDFPVNRSALHRVEGTMRNALDWMGPDSWACLSLGGGMPDFKEPIKACAEYFFDGRTFVCQAPQFFRGNFRCVAPEEEPPAITDSYRVRRHVESLIRKGSFVEAYGAASEMDNDKKEEQWVEKVRYAANYLTGALSQAERKVSLYPDYILTLLRPWGKEGKPAPRCLLVGMRVEAALWAGRIPDAVAASATFLDAAALDALEVSLPRGCKLDDVREIISGTPKELAQLEQQVSNGRTANSERRPPLRKRWDRGYRYSIGPANLSQWKQAFKPDIGQALSAYLSALQTGSKKKVNPIRLRHITVHSILKPQQVNEVKSVLMTAELWKSAPRQLGTAFLAQPLASNVLVTLGVKNPAAHYRTLIDGLVGDLRDYSMQ